jgi:ketosteroid isomerase-like protein
MTNPTSINDTATEIIALECAALDRWSQGDPSGFLELSAEDVVYFDPFLARRLDGREALQDHYAPLRGQVHISRYEMDNAKVQCVGHAAVLTFNFVSHGDADDGMRWNCTEVYRRSGTSWEIIQTHWSFTNGQQPK